MLLRAADQRLAAMDSPARLTTAAAPSMALFQAPASPLGVQVRYRTPARRGSWPGVPRKYGDLVVELHERVGQRCAEEPRPACDDDMHAHSIG